MTFIIGLLTVAMVLDCVLLILLVLIQLPKKDAGAGLAFGGAATDALFGAGSGNVLTKITKYATIVFFALAIMVGMLQSKLYHRSALSALNTPGAAEQGVLPGPAAPPQPPPAASRTLTNSATPPSSAVPNPAVTTLTNPAAVPAAENPLPVTTPTNPSPAAAPPQ
jgi:preprotein translocase subunit SecG